MGNIGSVRRIDDLGRVVIPKEIRSLLNIKNGELLNILVNDDSIILKKENESINIYNIINNLVNSYALVFGDVLIVSNRDELISCVNCTLKNKNVDELIKFIDMQENYESIVVEKMNIGGISLEGYFYIVPLFIDSNYFGVFCFVLNNKEKLYVNKFICKFMLKIIENKVDIT